jgi:hypothetical protein
MVSNEFDELTFPFEKAFFLIGDVVLAFTVSVQELHRDIDNMSVK